MSEPHFLRPDAAGAYLKDRYGSGSKKTLDKLASVGGGPEFHKMGRLRLYTLAALDAWAMARISKPMRSTSDRQEAA